MCGRTHTHIYTLKSTETLRGMMSDWVQPIVLELPLPAPQSGPHFLCASSGPQIQITPLKVDINKEGGSQAGSGSSAGWATQDEGGSVKTVHI